MVVEGTDGQRGGLTEQGKRERKEELDPGRNKDFSLKCGQDNGGRDRWEADTSCQC